MSKDANDVVSKSFLYDFNSFFSTINSSIDNLQTTNSWSNTIADSFKVWVQQSSLYTDNSASGITLSTGSTITYTAIDWADISPFTGTLTTDLIENAFAVESPYFIATIILLQEMETLAGNVTNNSDATDASAAIADQLTLQDAPTDYTGPEILETTIRVSDGFTGFAKFNLELTLPNDHKIDASIQDSIQGLYEVTLTPEYSAANPGATVESLGITDYTSGDLSLIHI